MLEQGLGVEKNDKEAFKWMLASAKAGVAHAQNTIGLYYKNGTGVQANDEKAFDWLEMAERAGYPNLAKETLQKLREQLAKTKGMKVRVRARV